MAKLTGQTIADSYDQLLIVDDANGISSSLQAIESADTGGSASSLKISTSKVEVIPASDSTSLFEVSQNDGTPVLSVDTTNARVGIGTASPDSKLHLMVADASATADADFGHLVVENSGHAGINILAGASSVGAIVFGDSGDSRIGELRYSNNDDAMEFKTNNAVQMYINSSGNVGIGTAVPASRLNVFDTFGGTLSSSEGIRFTGTVGDDTNYYNIIENNLSTSASSMGFFMSSGADSVARTMTVTRTGVGIGIETNTAHLHVKDATIDTTANYYGIRSEHTKTAGTTTSQEFTGIYNAMVFDDSSNYYGNLMGIETLSRSKGPSNDESGAIYGINATAMMEGSTDVNNIYGTYITTDVNAGTVDSDVKGQHILVDVEEAANVAGSVYGLVIRIDDADTTGHTSYAISVEAAAGMDYFFRGYESENRILFTDDGNGYWDGAADNGAATDFAEYFESTDGSVIPIGNTVTLENGKIKQAEEGDEMLGVIRPHDGVALVGGSQWAKWKDKYLTDDYGKRTMEDYTYIKWSEEITFDEYIARGKDETGGVLGGSVKDEKVEGSKAIPAKDAVTQQKTVDEEVEEEVTTTEVVLEDGKYVQKTTTETVTKTVKVPQYDEEDLYDEDGEVIGKHQIPIMETVEEAVAGVDAVPDTYFREHKYHSDRIPEGLTAPDDAETLTPRKQRRKLNPDYDESFEYVPREERDEWHIVGLLGQIPVTKGQPVADNWIKMKDVSDTVEMYFVK